MVARLKRILRRLVQKTGYDIIPIASNGLGYINANAVLKEVANKNISLNQYLEDLWGMNSSAEATISQLDLRIKPAAVLEIGAGTGLFAEKLITLLGKENILNYEVYETDKDWAQYLNETIGVITKPANGFSLEYTLPNSMDIIHSHGVFVYTSFITTVSYLKEIFRVAKPEALVFFDVFDETCFDNVTINKWIKAEDLYPTIIPELYLVNMFTDQGFKLTKSFYAPFGKGRSRYFIFSRNA